MFVSIGDLCGTRRIASANDKSDLLVAGSAGIGWLHGPQVGARSSAVAELSPSVKPRILICSSAVAGLPDTVGMAVDIAFAEQAACEHFGAAHSRVAVVATSNCQFGDGADAVGQFISDVGAELVVMLDNGPVTGVPRSAAPAVDRCADEVCVWFAGRGRAMDFQVLWADTTIAVARANHTPSGLFRFSMHRQKQFEHRDNARNIKLCGGRF